MTNNTNNFTPQKFKTKIDLVRNYFEEVKIPERVDYDELYLKIINQFDDWAKKDKNVVIKYLKKYVKQINNDIINNQKGPKAKDAYIKQYGDYIISELKKEMLIYVRNDKDRYFALNRYVWRRLRNFESKPRLEIKKELLEKNGSICSNRKCNAKVKKSNLDVHRKDHNKAYSISNCVLLCKECHKRASAKERRDLKFVAPLT
ncbi:HNH endonuclease [Trichlorobacter lovleyi]|uniref:HNH endonuclease n=1 Tax=Trichlorobacter lovleyi TaxID=313985 RepID=UPI0023EFB339|nr:HNH endonuclease signature motif containing protein [Trichlorobacter lovleyi]